MCWDWGNRSHFHLIGNDLGIHILIYNVGSNSITSSNADAALVEDYEKTCALEEESIAATLFEHMKI